MKRIFIKTLLVALLVIAGRGTALASEGTARLSGQGESQCFLASVLVNQADYRLVMTCRNLLVPPETETLFYHAWAKRAGVAQEGGEGGLRGLTRSAFISLGDISSGKLSGKTRDSFDEVLVTAEAVSRPREPDLDQIVISGLMQPVEFGEKGVVFRLTPTEEVTGVTVAPTPYPTPAKKAAGRSVAGTAFRVFLGVLMVIVVFAVVISLLQRRSAAR